MPVLDLAGAAEGSWWGRRPPSFAGARHGCSCPGEGATEGGVACGSAEPRPAWGLLSGAQGLLHWCHFVCNVGLKLAFAECHPSVNSYRDQPREESGATTVFGGGNGLPAVSASLTPHGDRAQPRPSTRPVVHPGPAIGDHKGKTREAQTPLGGASQLHCCLSWKR